MGVDSKFSGGSGVSSNGNSVEIMGVGPDLVFGLRN